MLRWLIQDGDASYCATRGVHPFFKNMTALAKKGLDQPFWIGISHESFIAFLSHANLTLDGLGTIALKGAVREMTKTNLPNEMRNQIRRILLDESLLESKFEIELLLHIPGEPNASLPWDPLCEISTKGVEGVFQGIKACWMSLFRIGVLTHLKTFGLDLSKIHASIVIRLHQPEAMRGKAFSYSPRCPWDRRHLVVAYDKGREQSAFLVDRTNLHSSYYGKNSEEIEETAKTLNKAKAKEPNGLPASDKVKKVAEFLLSCEKMLEGAQQIDWSIGSNHRLILRRIRTFDRTPSAALIAPQYNTTALNFWDQTLLNWNPSALLKPFWFSLLPRNFRTLAIRYSANIGVKNKLPSDYEKVFRGFWGILRGRPYVNLAALHRFLAMGEHHDLAEELEMIVPIWMKRYDREMRESWDFHWPDLPSVSAWESKEILKKQATLLKDLPEKINIWIDQMHALRESLVSSQWKEKNVSVMLEAFQSWERKYIPAMAPILLAELQYWNLLSWYYQGAQKPSVTLTWDKKETREPLHFEGSWLARRTMEKMYDQMELLGQMRPKYLSMLEDIYEKLRKFFELMGQKYQNLGQIEKSEDLFYLTLEEMLALEEGRAATTSWKNLIAIRQEEYQHYARDQKVPEIWMTTGLVGVAARYPGVIAIRERKNPLGEHIKPMAEPLKPAKSIIGESTPSRALAQMDFIEDEIVVKQAPVAVAAPSANAKTAENGVNTGNKNQAEA